MSNYERLGEKEKKLQNLESATQKIKNFLLTHKKQYKQIIRGNEESVSQNVNNIFRRSMLILSKYQ